jgi:diguanylate cyclase (GGDEF)-like protein/PAS domain S-box-containing protein
MLRKMKHCSLFWQLVIPMITIGIVAALVTTYTAFRLKESVASIGDVYGTGHHNVIGIEDIDKTVARFRALSMKHLTSEIASEMDAISSRLKQVELDLTHKIDALSDVIPEEHKESMTQVKLLKSKLADYLDEVSEALELSKDFEKESAFELLSAAEQNHITEINDAVKSLIRHQFSELMVSRDVLESETDNYFAMTLGLGIGGATMLMIVAFVVTRRVTYRMGEVLSWSQSFSEGDNTATLRVDSNDEVGRLAAAMNAMAEKITHAHEELSAAKRHAEDDALALKLYANVFENSGEAILITDYNNRIIAVNNAFTRLTGYTFDEVFNQDPKFLSAGVTSYETYQEMWAALKKDGFWQGELWDRRKDGGTYPKWAAISSVPDKKGGTVNYIASYTDISERKIAEQQIYHLAHHDTLTGLLNRFSLEDRLAQAIHSARRDQVQLAVLFIDLDRFKVINDSYGHNIGDSLLVEVAHRLERCVRESDILARLGGDEFVVVLTGLENDSLVAPSAGKIVTALSRPYHIGTYELHSSPSIGISLFPHDGNNPDELMKHADAAMYHAKDQGRNNYQFFSAALTEAAEQRSAMESDLRIAISKQQFELYYQPQLHTDNKQIYGFEALLRWRHPERGIIPPSNFISLAEECGLIETIGTWVMDEACRQLAIWQQEEGANSVRMAVNLSAYQLRSANLISSVQGILSKHNLSAASLELEVTESVAMDNPEQAISMLDELSGLGVSIAIDDFGTGYSSLAYLKRLPIQTLKLDRTFVRDIETDINDAEISAATLALAHNLGLKVVAEGVETGVQYEFLVRHQCDFLQGYLFSEPLPAPEATIYLCQYQSGETLLP